MDRRVLVIAAGLWISGSLPGRASTPEPEIGRFRAHVATLASSDYAGRRGPGAARAAIYVATEFKRLGLEPLFDGDYIQNMTDNRGAIFGHNVGARLPGSDPKLADEFIVVGAHFDHLGRGQGGAYFPGADDNASGVAMLLESARCFVQSGEKPRRGVVFLGFDREEDGLFGSRYFVEHSPIAIEKIKLFLTADMIGRALGGVADKFVFAFGAETSPGLKLYIDEATRGEPIRLGLLGNDLLVVDRSDYGPFRARKVPYLFFSTGENPHYHQSSDTSDTIDYPKAVATARVIHRVLKHASLAETLPGWNDKTEPSLDEAIFVRDILRVLLQNREKLKIGTAPAILLRQTLGALDGIVSRGKITPAERSRLARSAQILLYTIL